MWWVLLLAAVGNACLEQPGASKVLYTASCYDFPGWKERFASRFPDYNISIRTLGYAQKSIGRLLEKDDQTVLEELFARRSDEIDVYNLEYNWLLAHRLSGHLLEFDPLPDLAEDVAAIPEIWLHRGPTGRLVSLPVNGGLGLLLYRKDLFDKYGIHEWPSTWDGFTAACRKVQEGERREQQQPFHGYIMYTGTNPKRTSNDLAMLLSSDGGTPIVEADGRVTVNNPKAAEAIRRWRNWIGDIIPLDALENKNSKMVIQSLKRGEAAVALLWSQLGAMQKAMAANPEWDIRVGTVPNGGSFPAGGASLAINAYSKHKEAAVAFVQEIGGFPRHHSQTAAEIPTSTLVEVDPEVKARHCKVGSISCKALDKYGPSAFRRITSRPSEGCGALLPACEDIIFRYTYDALKGVIEPEEAVAGMEHDLKLLLGYWEEIAAERPVEEWTPSRVELVSAGSVVGLLLVVVGAVMWRDQQKMRSSGVVKVPIAMVLSLVLVGAMAVTLGVVVCSYHYTTRDLASSLSGAVRTQSLRGAKQVLDRVIVLYVEQGHSQLAAAKAAIGVMKANLWQMQLPPSSLVVLLDCEDSRVLMSSDSRLQREGVVVSEDTERVHPWVTAALNAIGNWQNGSLDAEVVLSFDAEVSMLANAEKLETSHSTTHFNWLVIYCVPESAVLRDVKEELYQSLDYSILLTLVAVLVVYTSTLLITRPLVQLAGDVECVRVLAIEDIPQRTSVLSEVSSLLVGFRHMRDSLKEYKAFMPRVVFVATESDTGTDVRSPILSSHSSKRSLSSPMALRADPTEGSRLGVMHINSNAVVLTVRLLNPTQCDAIRPSDDFGLFVAAVELAASAGNGLLHLSTANPDEVLVTWNVGHTTVGAVDRAFHCASVVRHGALEKALLSASICHGKAHSGNFGTETTRSFGLMGPVMKMTKTVSAFAERLSREACTSLIVAEEDTAYRLMGRVVGRRVGMLPHPTDKNGSAKMHELVKVAKVKEEEWMYQIAETQVNDKLADFFASFLESSLNVAKHDAQDAISMSLDKVELAAVRIALIHKAVSEAELSVKLDPAVMEQRPRLLP